MRKTMTTAALLLALGCPASAGEMHTPGSPAPPTTTTSAVQEPAPETQAVVEDGVRGSMTEIALDLLSLLPSFF